MVTRRDFLRSGLSFWGRREKFSLEEALPEDLPLDKAIMNEELCTVGSDHIVVTWVTPQPGPTCLWWRIHPY
ncbi:MAG TPA: hypothetical protein ENM97_05160 [Moorella mulderi]|nr:hypothetical protein [Moorella mulderi]